MVYPYWLPWFIVSKKHVLSLSIRHVFPFRIRLYSNITYNLSRPQSTGPFSSTLPAQSLKFLSTHLLLFTLRRSTRGYRIAPSWCIPIDKMGCMSILGLTYDTSVNFESSLSSVKIIQHSYYYKSSYLYILKNSKNNFKVLIKRINNLFFKVEFCGLLGTLFPIWNVQRNYQMNKWKKKKMFILYINF